MFQMDAGSETEQIKLDAGVPWSSEKREICSCLLRVHKFENGKHESKLPSSLRGRKQQRVCSPDPVQKKTCQMKEKRTNMSVLCPLNFKSI